MTPREEELFGILQEEAAEVIQAVSKRKRFGASERNVAELLQEVGDVFALLYLLENEGYLDLSKVDTAMKKKLDQLDRNMTHKLPSVPAKSTKN